MKRGKDSEKQYSSMKTATEKTKNKGHRVFYAPFKKACACYGCFIDDENGSSIRF